MKIQCKLQLGDHLHDPGDPDVGIAEFTAEVVAIISDKYVLARDGDWWIVVFPEQVKGDFPIIGDGEWYPKGRVWKLTDEAWIPLDEVVKEWGELVVSKNGVVNE